MKTRIWSISDFNIIATTKIKMTDIWIMEKENLETMGAEVLNNAEITLGGWDFLHGWSWQKWKLDRDATQFRQLWFLTGYHCNCLKTKPILPLASGANCELWAKFIAKQGQLRVTGCLRWLGATLLSLFWNSLAPHQCAHSSRTWSAGRGMGMPAFCLMVASQDRLNSR